MYIYIHTELTHRGIFRKGGGADFWGQMPPPTLSKRKSKREKKGEKREKDERKKENRWEKGKILSTCLT